MPELTPMQKQYFDIKTKHPEAMLFFRLGDFYEMFGPDAVEASKILNITLTARNKGTPSEMPMCGVPYHAAENYIAKLTRAGKKVAICDQMSDPTLPGLVERAVTRIVTPGTTLDGNLLDAKNNNFLISLILQKESWGLALADLTTGEFKVAEINSLEILKNEINRLNPAEVIIAPDLAHDIRYEDYLKLLPNVTIFSLPAFEKPDRFLANHFEMNNLASFGIEDLTLGIEAAANLLGYLADTQKTGLNHFRQMSRYAFENYMVIDQTTSRNLDLFYNAVNFSAEGSLLEVIDETATAMGGRLLRRWLALPLISKTAIEERLEAVAEIKGDAVFMSELEIALKSMVDLERLVGRIGCNRANARDLAALKNGLGLIPRIKELLNPRTAARLRCVHDNLEDLRELVNIIEATLVEVPPLVVNEGGMIRAGYDAALDDLRAVSTGGKDWMRHFQAAEITRTGINSLKVGFNNVFGYFIEISKANLASAPADYIRKQTLVNAERFITPELKEYEEKVLGAEEKIKKIEWQIFQELREKTSKYFERIQRNAALVAELDVLFSFALIARKNNYHQPRIAENGEIKIKNGRHPVIEKFQNSYVPNDLHLDHEKSEFILLTGPNMSGKSSYLRQTAVICLMAQIGSFVPADEAELAIVDRILTRVGASDNLSRGVSTFMAEMQEAANILNNATKNSLIILDEIGRGTSTYDGLSIAWSLMEYIHDQIQAKTLFATHYHELVAVAEKLARAENYCVAVTENQGKVVFLHKIIRGATSKSYGIEVAKLAGLPRALIDRATEILRQLEVNAESNPKHRPEQAALILPVKENFLKKEMQNLNINEITPLDALRKLADWKTQFDKSE
jgi:DNA mismatch repair protein MutS